MPPYIHGYDTKEILRLQDQASTLVELLHVDTHFPAGSRVLEVGCGVGAQTVTLSQNSPAAHITSFDISLRSLKKAQDRIAKAGCFNVTLFQGDIFRLPCRRERFDHIFICFVLEHLRNPIKALQKLHGHLVPGGTITVIEGDHGSTFFYPDSDAAREAIRCQVELQRLAGGDANIGRALFPILKSAEFTAVQVSPRMVYADASRPHLVEGFTKRTFTAMIEGIREHALAAGIVDQTMFDQGIRDLYRTAEGDGVFCYTFFKATAIKV